MFSTCLIYGIIQIYMRNKEKLKKLLNMYTLLGFGFILITLVLIAIPISPYIWYRINPNAVTKDEERIVKEIVPEEEVIEEKEVEDEILPPPFNPDLPQGYFVLIPKFGINSPITVSKDYKQALHKGTWIVSDYGTPEDNSLPIILAAHRYGYASWATEKRNRIAFYNLPNTKIGDSVSIYWNQREYIYEIYGKEEGRYITDYTADLILYTCKYYNSPIRIFRYANRVN
jgi:sortase (surface protein transpeptidase)